VSKSGGGGGDQPVQLQQDQIVIAAQPLELGLELPPPLQDQLPAAGELATVEQQARNGGEVASTSPNGTPAASDLKKARAAKTFRAYLPSQCHRTYSCVHCRCVFYVVNKQLTISY